MSTKKPSGWWNAASFHQPLLSLSPTKNVNYTQKCQLCLFADRIGVFVDFFPGIVDIILNLQIYRIMLQDAA